MKLRGRANGFLTLCHSIGMTSFPLLASILIGLYGWQTTWKIFGFIVWGIALIPVTILIRETPESMGLKPDNDIVNPDEQDVETSNEINWSIGQAVKTFSLWQLALSGGLFYIVHGGVNNHMAALLQDYGLTPNQAAIAISINAIFTGLGGLIWGWITDKLSMRLCYLILSGLMGISSIGFILVSGIFSAWITAAIFGISLGGLLVVPSVAIANYYGRNSLGTIRGFIEPFGSAGTAIGAILSGIIFDLTGVYEIALILLAIAAGLAFILMISSKPPVIKN
ncbi:MAG: MFS transporter [SAR202 cluster bacterium]|nr:MFS transporter [SAR202 cluster bacterium]